MKKLTRTLLIAVLTLTGVNLLVACTQKGGGAMAPAIVGGQPPSSPSAGGATPNLGAEGTSTSGGGTGLDGKVFESYIVTPSDLPAYTQYLKPLFENLKAEKTGGETHFDIIFKIKTWYIAPIELDKISKDLLGVSFIKSNTQQIARQTMKEVWIDKRVYDGMSLYNQSELLMHEFVMSLYLMKFIKMSDFCKISSTIGNGKNNDSCAHHQSDLLDKAMPSEEAHPLDDQDNANIRFVTGWLMQNAKKPIVETDFVRVLFNKGFDRRLFNPSHYGEREKLVDLKVSGKELYRAIRGAQLTGRMPSQCLGLTSRKSKACKVEVEEKLINFKNFRVPGYNLSVTIQDEALVNIFFFLGEEVLLGASEDGDGGYIYTHIFTDYREEIKIGDRLYSAIILFRKESPASQSGLSIESITLKPGVVVSIDKKRDPICLVSAPRVINLIDDGIIIQPTNPSTKFNVIQEMYSATPPFAACSAENTAE